MHNFAERIRGIVTRMGLQRLSLSAYCISMRVCVYVRVTLNSTATALNVYMVQFFIVFYFGIIWMHDKLA